ncbi:hypothetical protein CHUAL_007143 [Chamberlinius hualienensis]
MSRLNRKTILEFYPGQNFKRAQKKARNRQSCRYRTQPVTFYEIQEVDEENLQDTTESTKTQLGVAGAIGAGGSTTRISVTDESTSSSDVDLKSQLTEFSKSLPRRIAKKLESNKCSITEDDVGNSGQMKTDSPESNRQPLHFQQRPSI